MKFARIVPFILLLAATAAPAQYTAKRIVFKHPEPYTDAQLEAIAGMHPGMTFSSDDIGAAAQRLIDSGYFDTVTPTFEGLTNAASVIFVLKPFDRDLMLRVGFENFVWLTPAEIQTAILAKSPLFAGYVLENSALGDVFNLALTDALAAKGITATVTHDTIEPTMAQPERALEFRVSTPSVRVANIKLEGVTPALAPLVQKSANATARTAYNEGLGGQTTQDRILAPLFDAGYIQASLSNLTRTPSDIANGAAPIVLGATLTPGDIFHVSTITFAGMPLLSAEAFTASQKLHPGDIASRKLLFETLAPLDAAYRRQGYMDIVVKATPTLDAATHQVAYTVTAIPGEQYRMHETTANNLDTAARADFDRGFLMKPGELYNPEYVSTFLTKNTALQALLPYSATFKAYADPNTHTVDLVITFIHR